jgi:quercetin dioxygenase-like cupin family protein
MSKEKHTIYGPILIKPDDELNLLPLVETCAHVYILPEGRTIGNELGEVVYIKDATIPYHDHEWGYECFTIMGGEVDAYMNNKYFVLTPGDMFFIKPHVMHGFVSRTEGCRWRELFEDIRMYFGVDIEVKMHEQKEYQDFKDDPASQERLMNALGDYYRDFPVFEEADKYTVPQVMPADAPIRVFETEIGRFDLRVPRWDYDGMKEVWDFRPKKGLKIDFTEPFEDYPLYIVIEGEMTVECDGKTYEGKTGDMLHIPPWHIHSVSFPADGTVIQICNEQSELLHILEYFKAVSKNNPEDMKDWESKVKPVLREFNNWATAVSGV